MKGVGAALGHHVDLSAYAAAVFRLVAAGQNRKLRDRIDADGHVHTAVVSRVHVADTVDRELIL